MIDVFITWPMPAVWLMIVGLMIFRWRRSSILLVVSATMLIVSSIPIVGQALIVPLGHGAVSRAEVLDVGSARAVVVPTAGSFRDANGRWWPQQNSVRRFVVGLRIAEAHRLKLYAVGGAPWTDQPAEAETVVGHLAADNPAVHAVPVGRNSAESAAALDGIGFALPQPVVLVTDYTHVSRMRANLRAHGIAVAVTVVPSAFDPLQPAAADVVGWRTFMPSNSGLDVTTAALREYVGIAWYLASGHFSFRDLLSPGGAATTGT